MSTAPLIVATELRRLAHEYMVQNGVGHVCEWLLRRAEELDPTGASTRAAGDETESTPEEGRTQDLAGKVARAQHDKNVTEGPCPAWLAPYQMWGNMPPEYRQVATAQAATLLQILAADSVAVVELPEPTSWVDCEDDDGTSVAAPQWQTPGGEVLTAFVNGVESDERGLIERLGELRGPALQALAAAAACERFQAQHQGGEPR